MQSRCVLFEKGSRLRTECSLVGGFSTFQRTPPTLCPGWMHFHFSPSSNRLPHTVLVGRCS